MRNRYILEGNVAVGPTYEEQASVLPMKSVSIGLHTRAVVQLPREECDSRTCLW